MSINAMIKKHNTSMRSGTAVLEKLGVLFFFLAACAAVHAEEPGLLTLQGDGVALYQIGPDDVLDISIWREETLQRTVTVRPDGNISFPLVGEITAASRTPAELQREITERLKKYMPDPVVTVIVDKVASYKIYVIGEVKSSGQFQVGHYIDVVQALAIAGGLTPFASENQIRILRRENGVETAIPFQYSSVKAGRNLGQNIILKRGDVVVVP